MQNKTKIAIYYSGRIDHNNYEENKKHILQYNEKYDIVHFCSLNESANSLKMIEKFRKDFNIKDDQYNIEKTRISDEILNSKIRVEGNLYNLNSMFYHNYKSFELIKAYQEKYNHKFDIILKYRADLNSNDVLNFDISLLENTVYTPNCFDWGGLNDQVGYGTYESMLKYSECYLHLVDIARIIRKFHPETILNKYLEKINVNKKKIEYKYYINK